MAVAEVEVGADYAQAPGLNLLLAAALVGLLSMALYTFARRQTGRDAGRLKLPPGPRNLPIIGSMHLLSDPLSLAFEGLSRRYGPLMYMRLGSTHCIVVSDADTAKAFTTTHDAKFASRPYTAMGKIAGFDFHDVATAPYTPRLQRLRKLIATELMSGDRLAGFGPVVAEETAACVTRMWDANAEPVALRRELKLLTSNVIFRILLGKQDAAAREGVEEFADAIESLSKASGMLDPGQFFPAVRWMDLRGVERTLTKHMLVVQGFLKAVLDDRRARVSKDMDSGLEASPTQRTVADMLLLHNQAGKVSGVEVMAVIFDMYAGSVDSTSTAVEWGITALLNSPHLLKRAHQELDRAVGKHRRVEESDIANLPFLQAVVKETLRLYPPFPLAIPHYNEEAAEVNGYHIPAKTTVFLNLPVIGRDSRKWERPEQFEPDRFLNSNINVMGAHHQVLPFGAGRRMCPGAALGFGTTVRALATILHALDFQLVGDDGSIQAAGTQLPGAIDMTVAAGLGGYIKKPVRAVSLPRLPYNVYRTS